MKQDKTNAVKAQIMQMTTLQRERDTGRLDKLGRFDESAISWDISRPCADLITIPEMQFSEPEEIHPSLNRSFRVFITHDIDWVSGWEPYSLCKACLETSRIRSGRWLPLSRVVTPRVFENNIRRILDYEIKHNIGSYFFMLSGPHGFGRYSSRYDCLNRHARDLSSMILDAGMTIGLHGSYHARERNSYREEKHRLEDSLGFPINCHRNHYLRFDSLRMWSQLEDAGISYDFSIGYQSRLGFRAGTAQAYHPIDILKDRPSSVLAIPLLMMDTAVGVEHHVETMASLRVALCFVKQLHGSVSLLFHPESFLIDDRYWTLFEASIALCEELCADIKGTLPAKK